METEIALVVTRGDGGREEGERDNSAHVCGDGL